MKTPRQLGITKRQHQNLVKLTLFVRDKVAPPKFNISFYHSEADMPQDATYECGSSACFLGYAPLAGIEVQENQSWLEYCNKVFGCKWAWTEINHIYNLLFSSYHKNSKAAAIKRAAYFLTNGLPETMNYESWEAPRSFKPDWAAIQKLVG